MPVKIELDNPDGKVNVYLDDERGDPDYDGVWVQHPPEYVIEEPTTWLVVRTVADCIAMLETGEVAILSLDHDLGGGILGGGTDPEHTGYDVLTWLEEQVAIHENLDVVPEEMHIHSDNASVWKKMHQAIESINKKREALRVMRSREAPEES